MGRSSRQKINKKMMDWRQNGHTTVDKMNLIDIFRTFHPTAGYTFSSSTHGTFSKTDHMLGHKTGPSKFKKIEII